MLLEKSLFVGCFFFFLNMSKIHLVISWLLGFCANLIVTSCILRSFSYQLVLVASNMTCRSYMPFITEYLLIYMS